MANIEALLSQTGGSINGDRMYSGMPGLSNTLLSLGFGRLLAGPGAVKYQRKKALKQFSSTVEAREINHQKNIVKARINRMMKATGNKVHRSSIGKIVGNPSSFGAGVFDPESGGMSYPTRVTYMDKYRSAVKAQKQFLSKTRKIEAAVAKSGRFLSGLGWGLAISWAADLGFNLMTPKISAAATRSNDQLFTRSRADSGAAYTQRQRAMMAIVDSQSSIQNVVGNEAAYFHS